MMENSLLTILHISDFHFSKKRQREQRIVVDALIKDLKSLCIGHRKPDIVMFTGDLVHAAGEDRHDEAYDFLIDRVSQATGCSDERIFITPGNHDVARSGVEAFETVTKEWIAAVATDNEIATFNTLFENKAFDSAISAKFGNYLNLEHYISGIGRNDCRKITNSFVTVDYISAINTDVVVFNTAVLSAGGHKSFGGDERNLVIPEYAVMEAISGLTAGSLRVFVTHHPLNWLSEQSSKYVEAEIAKNSHIHLFGHMHDPQPKHISSLKGEFASSQAGAIFTSRREYYNGYSLITIDRDHKHIETLVRSYFKDRNEFDIGIDVIENGRWWSSTPAREHFRNIATPVDPEEFRAHLKGSATEALLSRERSAGGEGDLHGRFVAPPLMRTFINEKNDDEGKAFIETDIRFCDLVTEDMNLIIYARPEYGRTTLLRELRYRLMSEADTVRFPRLPAMLDFADIGSNVENMKRRVKAVAELCPEKNDLESLLSLGHACILIDDVYFSDKKRMKILRDFVEKYPKARYILSSTHSSTTRLGACIDPELPVRFEFVEVREFRRGDMRQMLARDERCTDVEVWLDRLQDEFREINLPFTAANGSILIEILSEKYNFSPINRSVLMEQFVDSTLRKTAIEQSKRETFDYTNKTDLLSHLAAWMAQNDEYTPSKEAVRFEIKNYIDSRGLNVDIDNLFHEFLSAKIFIARTEGRVSFRYRGVLEYFIALRMTSDSSFKDWVVSDHRYLSFINEIQYYAGKLRNDADLVNIIAARHQFILTEALKEIGEIDVRQLESLDLPPDTDSKGDSSLDAAAMQIAQPPLTQEEKDSELDLDIPTDAEDRQEVFRPKLDQLSDRLLLSLVLYSGLVKNMELISDGEKRKHLSAIWQSWSTLLVGSLRYAPRLAAERKVRMNGVLYEVQAPHGMSDASLLRQMMVQLPHLHVRMISSTLGTEKLERQLTQPDLIEQNEPKIFDFFRSALIADLRLPATPGALRSLAVKLRSNRYLLWSFIVHVSHMRRLDRFNAEHFRRLDEPLAGAIANLRGGSQAARTDEKRRQLARLKRDRLVLRMKHDRDR